MDYNHYIILYLNLLIIMFPQIPISSLTRHVKYSKVKTKEMKKKDMHIKYRGSCLLKASVVECRSIPSMILLDRHLDWYSINILIGTLLALRRNNSNVKDHLNQTKLIWLSMSKMSMEYWSSVNRGIDMVLIEGWWRALMECNDRHFTCSIWRLIDHCSYAQLITSSCET